MCTPDSSWMVSTKYHCAQGIVELFTRMFDRHTDRYLGWTDI